MLKNTSMEYGSVAKLLHWLIFILIICMLIGGYIMGDITDKALRGTVINLHKQVGLIILLLMLLRLAWALINVKPLLPLSTAFLERLAERFVHWTLYAVLILMPISGWVMSSAADHPPHFGSWVLNLPVPVDKTLSDQAFDVHYWVAIVIIALVSLHVFAALYHHYLRQDNILKRMWPWKLK